VKVRMKKYLVIRKLIIQANINLNNKMRIYNNC